MSQANIQELIIDTLSLLEWRLQRLEFVLNGDVQTNETEKQQAPSSSTSVMARVKKVEHSLQQLSLKSGVISDLIKLRKMFESA